MKLKDTNKELKIKKKKIHSLLKEKKDLDNKIKDSDLLAQDTSKKISEDALNKLPIESLKDLYSPPESITDSLNVLSEERKKRAAYLIQLDKINSEINQAKIDFILEKINLILGNLN